jgi:long-chain fatty acid transport protein
MRAPTALVTTLALLATTAHLAASDGYFDLGYGIKAKGMGGTGLAYAQDALAPATNPAGIAFIGDRVDGGLTCFMPDRSSTLGGTTYDGNGTGTFWIPEAGIRQALNERVALGLALFGNGGMNTTYDKPIFGTSNAGIDLSQLFIAPTVSVLVADGHALGVSLVLAYQRFEATGLQGFGIDDPGYDSSTGAGFRVGYTGTINSWLGVGASFQPRMHMTRFEKYDGLFAQHGGFDIPANYAAGITLTPVTGTTIALDVERILYSGIAAIGNELTMSNMMSLGADNGPGFGWHDVTVYKVGINQTITQDLSLRAGYNHCTQPIQENQTYFNILAPGVVQDQVTVGGTWKVSSAIEVSAFYAHAFENTVTGSGNVMGQDADLTMSQEMVGVGIGWTR